MKITMTMTTMKIRMNTMMNLIQELEIKVTWTTMQIIAIQTIQIIMVIVAIIQELEIKMT
jgi:hypothetical protein